MPMADRADSTARMRGVFVGSVAATVSVAAHGVGSGMVPSQSALALLCVVSGGIGWLVGTRRPERLARTQLMVMLAAAQALGHCVLTVVDAHHGHGVLPSGPMMAMHALAVLVCALLIRGAEIGARRAASAVCRVLPLLMPVIAVADTFLAQLPEYRPSVVLRLLASSGAGTRGPPVAA